METEMATKATQSIGGWTDEERAAMKAHAEEIKRAGGKGAAKAAEEAQACLDKIAEMPDQDRDLAERVHAIVTATVPGVVVKTYYGMPGWANEDDKMVLEEGKLVKPRRPVTVRHVLTHTSGLTLTPPSPPAPGQPWSRPGRGGRPTIRMQ